MWIEICIYEYLMGDWITPLEVRAGNGRDSDGEETHASLRLF